jgi:hypothetical protein
MNRELGSVSNRGDVAVRKAVSRRYICFNHRRKHQVSEHASRLSIEMQRRSKA